MADTKQTQCADCWQWTDADAPHTCNRQIAANKKRARPVESEGFDRTERVEQTQRFWECDWETAILIDDCMGE